MGKRRGMSALIRLVDGGEWLPAIWLGAATGAVDRAGRRMWAADSTSAGGGWQLIPESMVKETAASEHDAESRDRVAERDRFASMWDGLSVRAQNVVRDAGISSPEELAGWSRRALLRRKNVGQKMADELMRWAANQGREVKDG